MAQTTAMGKRMFTTSDGRRRGETSRIKVSTFMLVLILVPFFTIPLLYCFVPKHDIALLDSRNDTISVESMLRDSRKSVSQKMTSGRRSHLTGPSTQEEKNAPVQFKTSHTDHLDVVASLSTKRQIAYNDKALPIVLNLQTEQRTSMSFVGESKSQNETVQLPETNGNEASPHDKIGSATGNVLATTELNSNQRAEVVGKVNSKSSSLDGLNCDAHGGPSIEIAKEMVYWEDIPSDNRFVSMYKKEGVTKYITFEHEDGGWNNQRMAVETIVCLAALTGRTLVVPPAQFMWNMNKDKSEKGTKQRSFFAVSDFFPFQEIAREHASFDVISMQEFLEREALTGHLRDKNGTVRLPPENRTDWNEAWQRELKLYLREIAHSPMWNPCKCMLVFPASTDPKDLQALNDIKINVEKDGGFPKYKQYIGKPNPVNASALERMKENWAEYYKGGKTLCVYDEEKQSARVLHFLNDVEKQIRLLTHFYGFIFSQDWRQDLWLKRFVRDHVRYVDSLQCAAARIVNKLRNRARARGDPDGNFEAFHIRREDFTDHFKNTIVDARAIYEVSRNILVENATVYIASDERNRSFFDPLREHFDLVFLDDFQEELGDLNTNFYGMIEQLVASRARSFFGCWKSTFTNYINRLRGYHANRKKSPGYEHGIIPSWYYTSVKHRDVYRVFHPVYQDYYDREFPTSWRLIDTGVND